MAPMGRVASTQEITSSDKGLLSHISPIVKM